MLMEILFLKHALKHLLSKKIQYFNLEFISTVQITRTISVFERAFLNLPFYY